MDSLIICKDNNNINIVATGDYGKLSRLLDYYTKLLDGKPIKLVSTSGINIDEVIRNQTMINSTFKSEFN